MGMAFRWNDHLKQQTAVAPAKAGAYRVVRVRLTDVMGPSLRWDDDEVGQKAICGRRGASPRPITSAKRTSRRLALPIHRAALDLISAQCRGSRVHQILTQAPFAPCRAVR